jgi:hypothetical protein
MTLGLINNLRMRNQIFDLENNFAIKRSKGLGKIFQVLNGLRNLKKKEKKKHGSRGSKKNQGSEIWSG